MIALGPLTNLAVAIALDDDVAATVKEFFWMGACLAGAENIAPAAEYNAYADPDALQVCLRHCTIPRASWELDNVIPFNELGAITGSREIPVAQFLKKVTEMFRTRREDQANVDLDIGEVICDPIAIATTFGEVEYSAINENDSVATDNLPTRGTTTDDMRIFELDKAHPRGSE